LPHRRLLEAVERFIGSGSGKGLMLRGSILQSAGLFVGEGQVGAGFKIPRSDGQGLFVIGNRLDRLALSRSAEN
jgi:hypothetical protein